MQFKDLSNVYLHPGDLAALEHPEVTPSAGLMTSVSPFVIAGKVPRKVYANFASIW
jgi:hypothetical protein